MANATPEQMQIARDLLDELKRWDKEGDGQMMIVDDLHYGKELVEQLEQTYDETKGVFKLPPEGDEMWVLLKLAIDDVKSGLTDETQARFYRRLNAFQSWLFEEYQLGGEATELGRRIKIYKDKHIIVLDGKPYKCDDKVALDLFDILVTMLKTGDKNYVSAKRLGDAKYRGVKEKPDSKTIRYYLKKLPKAIFDCLKGGSGKGYEIVLPSPK